MKNTGRKTTADYINRAMDKDRIYMADNLTWRIDRRGRSVQMMDAGGFVFDLDKKGCIVSMSDPSGKTFKWR